MSYKKKLARAGCVLALSGTPFAVHAQAVTYDFTGVVTGVSGTTGVTDGMIVTGTYTFDFANANPLQSSPPEIVGTTAYSWGVQTVGGPDFSGPGAPLPAPTVAVFSSTAHVGTFSYSSVQGGPDLNDSYVTGMVATSTPATYRFFGFEDNGAGDSGTTSFLSLPGNTTPPWTSVGLPIFPGDGTGYFNVNAVNGVQIDVDVAITSLTRVPESATGWLLLMGLGGLVFARRRSATP